MVRKTMRTAFFAVVFVAQVAFAQEPGIRADQGAPAPHRPDVTATAGGVPQVNITAPNQAGLSYNRYQQFDVGSKGAILNNARQHTKTELGGWIDANPNLARGNASVIVNEVNSSRPSHLNGYVEVAGQRADVIIANPSGINVNGFGFINTNQATLTTGRPEIDQQSGRLTGFRVEGGHIAIDGAGMDASRANYTNIISRSASVNAGIWANDLQFTTGRNMVSPDGKQATPLDDQGEKMGVALDVSELGGMYAGYIKLIGTEKGLGVRNAGEIVAQAGEVVISADGKLSSSGVISGKSGVTMSFGDGIANSGRVQSSGDIFATANGAVENAGEFVSAKNVSLSGTEFQNTGSIQMNGSAVLAATDGAFSNTGVLKAGGDIDVEAAQSFVNDGVFAAGKDIEIYAGAIENTDIIAGGNVELYSVSDLVNAGELQSEKAMTLSSETGGIDSSGSVLAKGNLELKASGDITTSGGLYSNAGLKVTSSNGFFKNSDEIYGAGQFSVNAFAGILNTGDIQSAGGITLVSDGGAFANSGSWLTQGALSLRTGGDVVNNGSIRSVGGVEILATGGVDNSGLVYSKQGIDFSGASGFINSGDILAEGILRLASTAGRFTSTGTLHTNGNFFLSGHQGVAFSGTIQAGGAMTVDAKSGGFISDAEILALGNLTLEAFSDISIANSLQVGGAAYLTGGKNVENKGSFYVQEGMEIAAAGSIANSGKMTVQRDLQLKSTAGTFSNDGTVLSGGLVDVAAATGIRNAGAVQSASDLKMVVGEGSVDNSGSLIAGGDLSVAASNNIDNRGDMQSAGAMALAAASGSIASDGSFLTEKTFSATTGTGFKVSGGLQSSGDVDIRNGTGSFVNEGEFLTLGSLNIDAPGGFANSGDMRTNDGATVVMAGGKATNTGSFLSNDDLSLTGAAEVTNSGDFKAVGDVTVASSGAFKNTGDLMSGGDLSLRTGGKWENSGKVESGRGLTLEAGGDIVGSGSIAATGDAHLSGRNMNLSGKTSSGGTLRMNAQGDLVNAGELVANTNYLTATGKIRNTGVIDGGDVVLNAKRVENVRQGGIFGDMVAIGADSFLNGLDVGDTYSQAGLIGARQRLDIGARDIVNREDGMIYSGGDIFIGGALDADYAASGSATKLLNASATIDATDNMYVTATDFIVRNDHFKTTEETKTYTWSDILPRFGWGPQYSFRMVWIPKKDDSGNPLEASEVNWSWGRIGATYYPTGSRFNDFKIKQYTETITETKVTETKPGYVYVGGTLHVTGHLTNDKSQIPVETLVLSEGSKMDIVGAEGTFKQNILLHVYTIKEEKGDYEQYYWANESGYLKNDNKAIQLAVVPNVEKAVYTPPEKVSGKGGSGPDAVDFDVDGVELKKGGEEEDLSEAWKGSGDGLVEVAKPEAVNAPHLDLNINSGMFTINTSPTSSYVIETNPRLTNYGQWLGSDYMLKRLSIDPNTVHKRLGDGFYEQRLIREQVLELTGRRFLDGQTGDEDQYVALMNAGADFAEEFKLTVGIALTADQMKRLTSDIVWLEYVTVDTPQGPVTALAPKLYLAPGRESLIDPKGTLVSAKTIDANLVKEINNSGTLFGSDMVAIKADNITNSGNIAGRLVSLAALNDLTNAGAITGVDAVILKAGRDLTIASTTVDDAGGEGFTSYKSTGISNMGSVNVTSEDGSLTMAAGRDISLTAALVESAGSLSATAGRDLNINTVDTSLESKVVRDSRNYGHDRNTEEVGSILYAGKDMSLQAGRDLTIKAGEVQADGNLALKAENDISITEGRATSFHQGETYSKKKGFLSSKSTATFEREESDVAVISALSGNTVTLEAGNDFLLRGSEVAASNGLSITAGGDVDILSADNYSASEYRKEEKRSGLSASFGGGRAGISIGKSKEGEEHQTNDKWSTGSLVGSEKGDVTIYAGKDVLIKGSRVVAGADSVGISGENVTIANTFESQDSRDRYYQERSGFSLSVGLTGAAAQIAGATMNAAGTLSKAQNARSDRAGVLYGIAAAREGYDAGKGLVSAAQNPGSLKNVGVSVNLGFSSSKNESVSTSSRTTASGSSITGGKDVIIEARGRDGVADTGNLTIIGSEVKAGGTVVLQAKNDIDLLSAEETYGSTNRNSSSSSGVGVGFEIGSGGYGFTVDGHMSKSKGSGAGQGVTHKETVIEATDTVRIISGGDTTLKGAQVAGGRVEGEIGGDLSIISEQDTFSERQNQSSWGGGISVGIGSNALTSTGGNFNTQKQKGSSDYSSVNEQSGIFAGDGGFDIVVGGHTGLKGGVIGSTADAEDNLLSTGSLSAEDLTNSSRYEATTKGWGGDFSYEAKYDPDSKTANKGSISPGLPMKEKGGEQSETKSAISEGTVVIRDEEAQLSETGQTADETVKSLNRDVENAHDGPLDKAPDLREIFDKQAELMDAAAAAGKAVAQTIGDISQEMYEKSDHDPRWAEGGIYKVILQGAGAALVAELGNGEGLNAALGAMASQLAAGKVQGLAQEVVNSLGASPEAEKLLANLLSNAISAGIGSAVGGESGGALASIMDRYNRQLHDSELALIKKLATDENGNVDEELRQRLEDAAYYLVYGFMEFAPGSPEWLEYVGKFEYAQNNLQAEIDILRNHQGKPLPQDDQFGFSWDDEFSFQYFQYSPWDLKEDLIAAKAAGEDIAWSEVMKGLGESATNLDTIRDAKNLIDGGSAFEQAVAIASMPFLVVDGALTVIMPIKSAGKSLFKTMTKSMGKETAERFLRVMGTETFETFAANLSKDELAKFAAGLTDDVAEIIMKEIGPEGFQSAIKIAGKNGSEMASRQVAEQLAKKAISQAHMAAGKVFESEVLKQFGLTATKELKTTVLSDGIKVAFIPDGISTGAKLLVECKDVKKLTMSNQLRAYFTQTEAVHIIVSPKTKTISSTVINQVKASNGVIEIFDPVTKQFSLWPGF